LKDVSYSIQLNNGWRILLQIEEAHRAMTTVLPMNYQAFTDDKIYNPLTSIDVDLDIWISTAIHQQEALFRNK
jgi:hypothetical protein